MLTSLGIRFLLLAFVSDLAFVCSEPTWHSLRATWGLNLLKPQVFARLPKTETLARKDGFERLDGPCSGGKFLGHRYMKGTDTTAVMLYDVNGFIAGIQHGIPKNDVEKVNTTFSFANSKAYQLDKILGEEEIYFITTYFVDPSIICTSGRTEAQYEEEGTGTGLHIQNGEDPIKDTDEIPLYEKDIPSTSEWLKGGCFVTMGVHYWKGAVENMKCSDSFPITVIYNRGKITAFAFVSFGKYDFSKRFEYPPRATFSLFMPHPVPKCLYGEYDRSGGSSTMHVFFSVRPWNVMC